MAFTQTQTLLRDNMARIAREKIAPRAGEIDETDEFPEDLHEFFVAQGIEQMAVPREYGGSGSSVTDLCIVREEFAKYSYAISILAGQMPFVGVSILVQATPEQKQHYLGRLAAGELCAFGLTEAGGGSDAAAILTRAERKDGGYVLNGSKFFLTLGNRAELLGIFAKTDPSAGWRGVSLFMVERDTPGLQRGAPLRKLGTRGLAAIELGMQDVFVPEDARIGPEGEGFKIAMHHFNSNRVISAAGHLGLAEGAYEYALAYAKQRYAFGQPIAEFQGIQWMLAEMATGIEAGRGLVYRSAEEIDAGHENAGVTSMAKYFNAELVMRVATDAVQILAGHGYISDHPVERFFRDAKFCQIHDGTSQIQKNIIAREILRGRGSLAPVQPAKEAV